MIQGSQITVLLKMAGERSDSPEERRLRHLKAGLTLARRLHFQIERHY